MATRPITITLVNNTGETLTVADFWHNHGTQPTISSGSAQMAPGGSCSIYAKMSAGASVGPQGGFNYYVGSASSSPTKSPNFRYRYNHPYGPGKTSVDANAPPGYKVVRSEDHLQHHDAYCTDSLKIS